MRLATLALVLALAAPVPTLSLPAPPYRVPVHLEGRGRLLVPVDPAGTVDVLLASVNRYVDILAKAHTHSPPRTLPSHRCAGTHWAVSESPLIS
jgi:hypothetical protein